MTQAELSEASGVSLRAIEEFEAGKRMLNGTSLQALRSALELNGWAEGSNTRVSHFRGVTIDPRSIGLGEELVALDADARVYGADATPPGRVTSARTMASASGDFTEVGSRWARNHLHGMGPIVLAPLFSQQYGAWRSNPLRAALTP